MIDHNDLLKRINILVVDDMEAMRGMIKMCLQQLGAAKVSETFNGEAAWKILQSKRIDLIVCDWDMPKMTGIQLLEKIRTSQEHQHIPFLLLTATTDKKQVISAIKMGVSDYLSKPFQPKELEFRIIKLLRKVDINKP